MASRGKLTLLGVYFSPNRPLRAFEKYLDDISVVVRRAAPTQILVLGDLNAKSAAWGCPSTDPKGTALYNWATTMRLEVLNRGGTNTCVRRQGGSIVDISLANTAVARGIHDWRVIQDVETLSDHRYIRMELASGNRPSSNQQRRRSLFPRWKLTGLDPGMADEAAMVEAWNAPPSQNTDIDEQAAQFRTALSAVCDAAMPRARRLPTKKQVYWWTEEIAALRYVCNRARRDYTRCRRRRRHTAEQEDRLYRALQTAKQALTLEIARRKNKAREEFLATLDKDPWGRPYKLVRSKLKHAPPTESMPPELLNRIVTGLFPIALDINPPNRTVPTEPEGPDDMIPPISEAEMERAINRLKSCKKAPGPDGVPGKVLAIALNHLGSRLKELLDSCLRAGSFPNIWKERRLCLVRKESRPSDSPSGYRLLVLLDETSKIYERILAGRITDHLQTAGPNISDRQFGFRPGLSTMDALMSLRDFSQYASRRGEGVVAVSLDIANAFGTLPYPVIKEAFRFHNVPRYLSKVLEHYLSERKVLYVEQGHHLRSQNMTCGVPQGSVLGPLLWNLGYDWLLRGVQLPRMVTICYADDTMVAVRGKKWRETMRRAAAATKMTVDRIQALGLEVAIAKSEAIVFQGRNWPVRGRTIATGGGSIQIKPHIKYLGLTLDRKWDYTEHFARLGPRIVGAASALGRLLPNVGGPRTPCRRLYAGIIRSMALYGAPIWADQLAQKNIALLRRPQRVVTQRIVRAYRTISHAASCLLASTPPWELDARVMAERYRYKMDARTRGVCPDPVETERLNRIAGERLRSRWKEMLEDSPYGTRTIEAILPALDSWLDRRHGSMSYRLTQIMTGHGCFGHYLHKIGREPTMECHECGENDDSAQHTLEQCPAWAAQRAELQATIGGDLSLRGIIPKILQGEDNWKALCKFCEDIMCLKEEAERTREESANAHRMRRRRTGRRRRQYASNFNH